MPNQTKLAAILHADVVGSTALVHEDERLAHDTIHGCFRRFSEFISAYSGHAHEVRGDAIVAEFNRASDAVLTALAFQTANSEIGPASAERATGPAVRIGIALGEVVIADGTVTGVGVILAQRIEQLAEPNGICISSAVREALPNRLPITAEPLGEQSLKGFKERANVYRLRLRVGEQVPPPTPNEDMPSPTHGSGGTGDRPTLIVLPFTTRGSNEADAILCDGISEDLSTGLSAVRWLLVMARPIAVEITEKTRDVKQIGKELGIRYVLTGSVRRVAARVRVTVQLSDARSGAQVWSHRYDRVMEDLFELQDDLSRSITAEIAPELAQAELAPLSRVKAENLSAWMAYQQGLAHLHRNDAEGYANARGYLEEAIALDPKFGSALSALAYVAFHELGRGLPSAGGLPATVDSMLKPAEEAIALDPHDGVAHVAVGLAHLWQRNYDAALVAVQRGIDLYPSSVFGYMARAAIRAFGFHQATDALQDIDFANRLSPSASVSDAFGPLRLPVSAYAHLQLRNYDQAAHMGEEALRAGSFYGPMTACVAHRCRGNDERAAELIKIMCERHPRLDAALVRSRLSFFGDRERLEWFVSELMLAGLPEKTSDGRDDALEPDLHPVH